MKSRKNKLPAFYPSVLLGEKKQASPKARDTSFFVLDVLKLGFWLISGVGRLVFGVARSVAHLCTLPLRGLDVLGKTTAGSLRSFVAIGQGNKRRKEPSKPILEGAISRREYALFPIFSVVVALVLILLPSFVYFSSIKSQTLRNAQEGVSELAQWFALVQEGKYDSAQGLLANSSSHFQRADDALSSIHIILRATASSLPIAGKELADRQKLLEVASELPPILSEMTQLLKLIQGKDPSISAMSALSHLGDIRSFLDSRSQSLEQMASTLVSISPASIPAEYRATFQDIRTIAGSTLEKLHETRSFLKSLDESLGFSQKKRYLFVLQNNAELRPTGGFIGTIAIVDVDRGGISSMSIPGGGPYDLQGSLTERLIAPRPLHLVTYAWQFQDANWFPDFPTSARKLAWFYERSGGSSVDGVIAVNGSVIQHLLKLTGPIQLQKYRKTITSENFFEETQRAVQFDYDKTKNKPKAFLADMAPLLIEQTGTLAQRDPVPLLSLLLDSVKNRDIQMFFSRETVQLTAESLGVSGKILPTTGDYLGIYEANVGGDKSDAVTTRDVSYHVSPSDTGIIATLTLTRTNAGKKNNRFLQPGQWIYMRAYVPSGSRLVSAGGFESPAQSLLKRSLPYFKEDSDLVEIEQNVRYDMKTGTKISSEFGKTVFGNWMYIPLGESRKTSLTYYLPHGLAQEFLSRGAYQLYVQRQSGLPQTAFNFSLDSTNNVPSWFAPSDANIRKTNSGYAFDVSSDMKEDISIGFHK